MQIIKPIQAFSANVEADDIHEQMRRFINQHIEHINSLTKIPGLYAEMGVRVEFAKAKDMRDLRRIPRRLNTNREQATSDDISEKTHSYMNQEDSIGALLQAKAEESLGDKIDHPSYREALETIQSIGEEVEKYAPVIHLQANQLATLAILIDFMTAEFNEQLDLLQSPFREQLQGKINELIPLKKAVIAAMEKHVALFLSGQKGAVLDPSVYASPDANAKKAPSSLPTDIEPPEHEAVPCTDLLLDFHTRTEEAFRQIGSPEAPYKRPLSVDTSFLDRPQVTRGIVTVVKGSTAESHYLMRSSEEVFIDYLNEAAREDDALRARLEKNGLTRQETGWGEWAAEKIATFGTSVTPLIPVSQAGSTLSHGFEDVVTYFIDNAPKESDSKEKKKRYEERVTHFSKLYEVLLLAKDDPAVNLPRLLQAKLKELPEPAQDRFSKARYIGLINVTVTYDTHILKASAEAMEKRIAELAGQTPPLSFVVRLQELRNATAHVVAPNEVSIEDRLPSAGPDDVEQRRAARQQQPGFLPLTGTQRVFIRDQIEKLDEVINNKRENLQGKSAWNRFSSFAAPVTASFLDPPKAADAFQDEIFALQALRQELAEFQAVNGYEGNFVVALNQSVNKIKGSNSAAFVNRGRSSGPGKTSKYVNELLAEAESVGAGFEAVLWYLHRKEQETNTQGGSAKKSIAGRVQDEAKKAIQGDARETYKERQRWFLDMCQTLSVYLIQRRPVAELSQHLRQWMDNTDPYRERRGNGRFAQTLEALCELPPEAIVRSFNEMMGRVLATGDSTAALLSADYKDPLKGLLHQHQGQMAYKALEEAREVRLYSRAISPMAASSANVSGVPSSGGALDTITASPLTPEQRLFLTQQRMKLAALIAEKRRAIIAYEKPFASLPFGTKKKTDFEREVEALEGLSIYLAKLYSQGNPHRFADDVRACVIEAQQSIYGEGLRKHEEGEGESRAERFIRELMAGCDVLPVPLPPPIPAVVEDAPSPPPGVSEPAIEEAGFQLLEDTAPISRSPQKGVPERPIAASAVQDSAVPPLATAASPIQEESNAVTRSAPSFWRRNRTPLIAAGIGLAIGLPAVFVLGVTLTVLIAPLVGVTKLGLLATGAVVLATVGVASMVGAGIGWLAAKWRESSRAAPSVENTSEKAAEKAPSYALSPRQKSFMAVEYTALGKLLHEKKGKKKAKEEEPSLLGMIPGRKGVEAFEEDIQAMEALRTGLRALMQQGHGGVGFFAAVESLVATIRDQYPGAFTRQGWGGVTSTASTVATYAERLITAAKAVPQGAPSQPTAEQVSHLHRHARQSIDSAAALARLPARKVTYKEGRATRRKKEGQLPSGQEPSLSSSPGSPPEPPKKGT